MARARAIRAAGTLFPLLVLFLLPASGADGQSQASVSGTVLDEVTVTPIEGAIVSVVDGDTEVETDRDGRFVLRAVSSGAVTLRVEKPGYGSVVEQVDASSIGTGAFEVLLPRMETMLEELLVRGRDSDRTGYKEYEVSSNDRYQTAVDLLANDVPGVSVGRRSGNVGEGSPIRIRGIKTIMGGNSPAIFLDGIRIDTNGPGPNPTGNGTVLGVLESIPADQVDRIRVLSGPAATSRFMDGANGVILIETVRGGDRQDRRQNDDGG